MARASNGSIDVDSLSLKELTALLNQVEAAIPEKKKSEIVELRAKLEAVAAEAGYTLAEVVGGRSGKRGPAAGSGTVAVKYRNPDNPAETWSGRGRTARWLAEKLKKRGVKVEDFAI